MKKYLLVISSLLNFLILFELFFYHLQDEIMFTIFGLICILLIFLFVKRYPFFIPKKFSFIYLGFIIISFLSFTRSTAFLSTLEILRLFDLYFLVVLSFNIFKIDRKVFLSSFVPTVSICALLSLFGILEFTGRISPQKMFPLTFPFDWPELAASIFILMIPPSLYYFSVDKKENKVKSLCYICLFLLLTALFLSQRFIILGVGQIVFICFFYILINRKKTNHSRQNILNFAILSLFVVTLLPNLYSSFGGAKISKEISMYHSNYFFLNKNDTFRFSKEITAKNLFLGIGPGLFEPVYRNNLIIPWTWSKYAGNEFMQTFTETGILGVIIESALLTYLVFISIRKISQSIYDKDLLSISLSISIITFIILQFFTFSIRIFPISIVFYFIMSFILPTNDIFLINKKIVSNILIGLLFIHILLFSDSIIFNLAKRYLSAGDYNKANSLLSWILQRPKVFLNPNVLIWNSGLKLMLGDNKSALDYLKSFQKSEEYNPEGNYQIAALIYKAGDRNMAEKYLEEGINKNPFVPPKYYSTAAKIALEDKNVSRAISWLKKGTTAYPQYQNPNLNYLFLSIIDSIDYLAPVQNIYFQLFDLTNDQTYLNSLIKFTY